VGANVRPVCFLPRNVLVSHLCVHMGDSGGCNVYLGPVQTAVPHLSNLTSSYIKLIKSK
jgi:hypothetical protein